MLANLLGLQGISTLVLEREAAILNLPRAVHFNDEVMRLLQTVGLAQAMQPFIHVSPGMKFVDDAGRRLLDWPRSQEVGQQGSHASYRFHQPEFERGSATGLRAGPPSQSGCGPRHLRWSKSAMQSWSATRTSQPAASCGAGRGTWSAVTVRARWCAG